MSWAVEILGWGALGCGTLELRCPGLWYSWAVVILGCGVLGSGTPGLWCSGLW